MTTRSTMHDAVATAVSDGASVYLAGFSHLVPYAAGHEMIRQGVTDLTVARAAPDLVLDQLLAAGCVSKAVFSWAGNPGFGSLPAFRRAVEDGVPNPVEVEEYTHFGLVTRLAAGAQNLPFLPLRSFRGSDLPEHTDAVRTVESPYGDGEVVVVPPLRPDVALVHAQRADGEGNAHVWGIEGDVVDAAFAADTVVLSVEEIVDEATIASDPNRTVIPGSVVDHLVESPYGAHPSYAQGYYDRDNAAYATWSDHAATHESIRDWLDRWVHGVGDREAYLDRLDELEPGRLRDLRPESAYAAPVNVGRYT